MCGTYVYDTSGHSFAFPYDHSPTVAAADIPGTVLNALIACGVDNVALFLGETQAQRIADDILTTLLHHV